MDRLRGATVTVRQFQPADAPAVSALIAATMRASNAHDYPRDRLEALIAYFTPEKLRVLAEERHCLVAFADEKLIGTAARESGTLATFFVDPTFQRRGVGSRLLDALESNARTAGLPELRVDASLTGAAFYERRGYGRTGAIVMGTAGPHVSLRKQLREPASRLGIWYWWLAAVYGASCVVGVLLVAAPFSPVMAAYNRELAETFWGAGDFPDRARYYHHWAMAVIGSTTAGWAVTNLWILHYAFRPGARWAHRALLSGMLTWAVLDLAVSLQLGAYVEAAFVLAAALLVLVPLVATRRQFTRAAGATSATDAA